MTRDDTIRMAREAGFDAHDMSDVFSCNVKDIERLVIAAYAAGFTNRDYLLAALKKLKDESHTIQGASDDYKQGREMGIQLCINELIRGEK